MDSNIKKVAVKQYFKYFRIWFILLGIIAIVFAFFVIKNNKVTTYTRTNDQAPEERVYDKADVLTDEEEQWLRDLIFPKEEQLGIDIILVTLQDDIEKDYYSWEQGMMNYADDFYDYNNYGFNKPSGDGVLLLDNWYEGQKGSWLSTGGYVYQRMSNYDIDWVLDEVYYMLDDGPYYAYVAYVEAMAEIMTEPTGFVISPVFVIFIPFVIFLVFILIKLIPSKGRDTTVASTYVTGGEPIINAQTDTFVRKFVTTRRIQTSSGGGHGGGGGGGGHRSSSGASHGGGGRRR